ncbi:uncharacterized protein ACRADG_003137 [Cochliomyia hominivorax]
MINTLLEHVPIKMEVKDVEDIEEEQTLNDPQVKVNTKTELISDEDMGEDDDDEDEEDDDEDEYDEEEEEEESDLETDALEIEQEATLLISSDEEAELEAQRIRFPDKLLSKKSRSDSTKSSRSNSRNSHCSTTSSILSCKSQVNSLKVSSTQQEDKKQRISSRLKATENNKEQESINKENNTTNSNNNYNKKNNISITTQITKKKTEKENINKTKQPTQQQLESNNKSLMDPHKASEVINKHLENNRNLENLPKSPGSLTVSKSRRGSNNSTCSVASTVASDTAETESCGNIYVFNLQQKLIFNCEFCDLKYGDLENFARHLHEAHKLFNFDEDPEKENAPRNLRKNSQNQTNKNSAAIKKEPLHSLDTIAEPPVALPLSVLAEPLNSCGNVFMLNHRKLFLICGYCECKYANLDLFEKHLRQQHRIFEGCRNEVNVVPKVEVKEEVYIITEVIPSVQQSIPAPQAMVAIPAEIPLDISINPDNQHLTEKALEEMEMADGNKKSANSLVSKSLTTDKEVEIVSSAESMEVDKPITPKKTRSKRRSSPIKPSNSPNKRPKRNTRNKNKIEEKSSIPDVAEKLPEITIIPEAAVPSSPNETENISDIVKSSENKEIKSRKSIRSVEKLPEITIIPEAASQSSSSSPKETEKPNEKEKNTESIKSSKNKEVKSRKSVRSVEKLPEITIIPEAATASPSPKETEKSTETIKSQSESNEGKSRKSLRSVERRKTITEVKEIKELKAIKESKDTKEPKESVDTKELKEIKGNKRNQTKVTETKTSSSEAKTESKNKTSTAPENVKTLNSKTPTNEETSESNIPVNTAELKNVKVQEESKKQRRKSRVEEPKRQLPVKETMEKTKTTRKSLKPNEAKKAKETKTKETEKESEKGKKEVETEKENEIEKQTETEEKAMETAKKTKTSLMEIESFKKSEMSNEVVTAKQSKQKDTQQEQDKPFECDICKARFRKNQGLLVHKKVHKADENNTPKSSYLQNHIQKKNSGQKHYFTCSICQRDFTTKFNVLNHIAIEHYVMFEHVEDAVQDEEIISEEKDQEGQQIKDDNYNTVEVIQEREKEALIAERITLEEPVLQVTEVVTNENLNGGDLDEDDLAADIVQQLQNEIVESRKANAVTFTINAVPDNLVLKIPNKSNTSPTVATADIMENELNSPQDIKPTLLQIVKRYQCDQCPRSFEKHIRLVEHKRLHTGEKPYECDECGKQFRIRMRLNEHKLRHSKEKKFKCEICELACCTKQDLNLHMRHHTNDRRFQCSMCPKAFVRSSDLKIHVRVHTGEKPYVCDICHKCFRANQNLSVHKKSHMGEASKTYQCEMCDKKFMRNIDRKVHMRSHTGEKPFKCEICQRGYSSKVNVRAHIERDHMSGTKEETPGKTKRKTGPKPKALREELEKQKKLIEELQQQLMQQIKTDEKIIPCDEDIPMEDSLQDCGIKLNTNDPIQSAYELLSKLKAGNNSKPLTIIPSPPPLTEPPSFMAAGKSNTNTSTTSTALLPLTITQKIEQHSPAPSCSMSLAGSNAGSTTSLSCLTTPSPPQKTTATKVVSQKTTSLGIQQVSVTVSMQVENVATTASPTTSLLNTPEKENAGILTTSTQQGTTATAQTTTTTTAASVKKERKITSYFTVVGQKGEV